MANKEQGITLAFRSSAEAANSFKEIVEKHGYTMSELFRQFMEYTVKTGEIPKFAGSKDADKELSIEEKQDRYVDQLIRSTFPGISEKRKSPEDSLIDDLYGIQKTENMSGEDLRDWGSKWGLPNSLTLSTLAELRDCGMFTTNPWYGEYEYELKDDDTEKREDFLDLMECRDNLTHNINKVAHKMHVRSMKYLMANR